MCKCIDLGIPPIHGKDEYILSLNIYKKNIKFVFINTKTNDLSI